VFSESCQSACLLAQADWQMVEGLFLCSRNAQNSSMLSDEVMIFLFCFLMDHFYQGWRTLCWNKLMKVEDAQFCSSDFVL
jgi:hypothetical protein